MLMGRNELYLFRVRSGGATARARCLGVRQTGIALLALDDL